MVSINTVIVIMVFIILTSSKAKLNICLHYVKCMHTNVSQSDTIHGDSLPGARVGVYRAFVDKRD
jgi:hypothetical protein